MWFDTSQIRLGERWKEKVQDALRDSRTLIVILSPNSDNPWIFFELGAAVADQKRIIPVVAENLDLESLPAFLKQFQSLREASPHEAAKKVAEVLEESVET
jgi:hypothetical protein